MYIDLYTILVDDLIGGFALTVLVLIVLLFFIMAWLGKMSKVSVFNFISIFLMTMLIGSGSKLFVILIGFVLLGLLYLEVRNTTSG